MDSSKPLIKSSSLRFSTPNGKEKKKNSSQINEIHFDVDYQRLSNSLTDIDPEEYLDNFNPTPTNHSLKFVSISEKKFPVECEQNINHSHSGESEKTIVTPSSRSSYFRRTFGPIKNDSLRVAIITLISTSLGTGLLIIPQAFANYGLVLAIIVITLAAMNIRFSLKLLSILCQRVILFCCLLKNSIELESFIAIQWKEFQALDQKISLTG